MGGAGMFSVSVYTFFMGRFYDSLVLNKTGAEAGREVLQATLIIPIILVVVFAGLFFYMKSRKQTAITETKGASL